MALYRKRGSERPVDSDGKDGLQLVIGPEEPMAAGPAGRHSRVIPSFGNTLSVTEPVTERPAASPAAFRIARRPRQTRP